MLETASPDRAVSFKIIFLDEADALTNDAQSALRRTMEKYAGTCRFVLSCNYSSKIMDPIQSRCAVFRFRPYGKEDVKKLVRKVANSEKIEVTADGLEALLYVAQGDMRPFKGRAAALEEISGRRATEDLLAHIFSRFCIGK